MLHKIVSEKIKEISMLKSFDISSLPPTRSFISSIRNSPREVSVIAEVKKASPSKGVIRADFQPVEIAKAYEKANVEAISVLTDVTFFQGSLTYLSDIRKIVNTPLLRKDFILDEKQIYEARWAGADCILLIAAILSQEQLKRLYETARMLTLEVLIEIHDEKELETVFKSVNPDFIGINNRNLNTFKTDIRTTERLIKAIPRDVTVISESGIHDPEDIRYLKSLGVRAVLVGEHFMRQANVTHAVEQLVGVRA